MEHALTHSSYANENKDGLTSNERLEFLGDSILGFVTAAWLYEKYPDKPEGELTKIRSALVCETSLAAAAKKIGLGENLMLGKGEEHSGGRQSASITADAMESVLAASYLDGGLKAAKGIIDRLLLNPASAPQGTNDHKTRLQELIQREKNQTISYQLLAESGPDHDKKFSVAVYRNGTRIGTGVGHSKKSAEQEAARAAIASLFPEAE